MSSLCCRLTLILLMLAALCGCDDHSTAPPAAASVRKISVVATVYPMADIARQVGGAHVDVQWLAETGQTPEEVETGTDLQLRVNNAQLVLASGHSDSWMSSGLSPDVREARIVEPGHLPAALRADPAWYLWLDPLMAQQIAEATRARLTVIDPRLEVELRRRTKTFQDDVDGIDREFKAALMTPPGRKVLTIRPVWGALCARYGLTLLAPVKGPESGLSAVDFKELANVAKAQGVRTLLIDVSTTAAVQQQLAEQTGLKVITLDALGSSAADGRNTWAKLMRYNLAQLKEALK